MQFSKKEYNQYVAGLAKKSPLWKDLVRSFCIGGLICALGQLIRNGWGMAGLDEEAAATATSVSLIFLSALFTGLSLYDDLAKIAGAGTIVPITGFANSVVSPAIEFKADARCIIRIVRENRNRRVSGLNPTYYIGKEILEAAIIPHDFRLPQRQMDAADPSGSAFLRNIIYTGGSTMQQGALWRAALWNCHGGIDKRQMDMRTFIKSAVSAFVMDSCLSSELRHQATKLPLRMVLQ